MWWQIVGLAAIGAAVFVKIDNTRRSIIMAVGAESAKAVAEVREAIATEVDQAATKIAEAVGADADTAAEIRTLLQPVKGIIPDPAVDTETGGDTESGEGEGEQPTL